MLHLLFEESATLWKEREKKETKIKVTCKVVEALTDASRINLVAIFNRLMDYVTRYMHSNIHNCCQFFKITNNFRQTWDFLAFCGNWKAIDLMKCIKLFIQSETDKCWKKKSLYVKLEKWKLFYSLANVNISVECAQIALHVKNGKKSNSLILHVSGLFCNRFWFRSGVKRFICEAKIKRSENVPWWYSYVACRCDELLPHSTMIRCKIM